MSEAAQCIDLFLQDKIEKCLETLLEKASYSLYHRYGVGVVVTANVSCILNAQKNLPLMLYYI